MRREQTFFPLPLGFCLRLRHPRQRPPSHPRAGVEGVERKKEMTRRPKSAQKLRKRPNAKTTRKSRGLAARERGLAKALKRLLDKGRGHIIDRDLDVTAGKLENDPRFLRRIEKARQSLRSGKGIKLEDLSK